MLIKTVMKGNSWNGDDAVKAENAIKHIEEAGRADDDEAQLYVSRCTEAPSTTNLHLPVAVIQYHLSANTKRQ